MDRRRGTKQWQLLAPFLVLLVVLAAGEVFAVAGDAARGARLFAGGQALANGGAACIACHGFAASGFGAAGGANFGPDLSGLYADFGDEGVAEVLAELAFPSMEPIYAERPLTEQEQADLGAFFAAVQPGPAVGSGTLLVMALVALGIFMGLIGLLGQRRLRAVRQPLVEQSRKQGGNQV
ncbi:cytochrome c [Geothermobacter ehrlichii]|uniref:Cytochrome c n=1 Tax=Geothermobacter ehrlichii TaxID=213224 RepID=A0A5D3WFN6_9BACT|nr:c-type cytochrome [Geothermobacter ehrlichii]TYO96689.1 cytochrome c [Geothermobacter ehrlichii]